MEFFDAKSLDFVTCGIPDTRQPFESAYPFYMLIEISGSVRQHDEDKLSQFLETAMERGLILNGTIAQDQKQAKAFWKLRESISEALSRAGAVYKFDISLPVSLMYDIVEEMRTRFVPQTETSQNVEVCGFGHLGDGNLHLNCTSQRFDPAISASIESFVYEWTAKHRGSVSAEHGLGLMKCDKIHFSKRPELVKLMHQMKQILDPNGILNPYKVLPSHSIS